MSHFLRRACAGRSGGLAAVMLAIQALSKRGENGGSEHTETDTLTPHMRTSTKRHARKNKKCGMTWTGLPHTMRVNYMGSREVGAVDSTSRVCCRHTSCNGWSSLSSPVPGSAVLPAVSAEGRWVSHNGCKHCPLPSRNSSRAAVHTSSVHGRWNNRVAVGDAGMLPSAPVGPALRRRHGSSPRRASGVGEPRKQPPTEERGA